MKAFILIQAAIIFVAAVAAVGNWLFGKDEKDEGRVIYRS